MLGALLWITFGVMVVAGLLLLRTMKAAPAAATPLRVLVVLGSGGHTSEMFGFISQLSPQEWRNVRPLYVVSDTDKDSAAVAERFEKPHGRVARVIRIPRAREVGQSYFTSIFTTLKSLGFCFGFVRDAYPNVILCNGPGVCIPVVAASYLLAALLFRRRPTVAYFESFTCVDHLSLSGKILRRIVDVFTVSWPQLYQLQGGDHSPNLRYCGPFHLPTTNSGVEAVRKTPLADPFGPQEGVPAELKKEPTAIVTVGSTCFDELCQALDTEAFFTYLKSTGIKKVLIQTGRTSYQFKHKHGIDGMECTVCEYKANLGAEIAKAALLISHAGAGTILEAMRNGTRTVVVPNERLMSNHQLQLAEALDAKQLLFCVRVNDLLNKLGMMNWNDRYRFPPLNHDKINAAIQTVFRRD